MWITKKLWKQQERKIADLEKKIQSQQAMLEKVKEIFIKLGCCLD